ncbi:MAG: ribosome small subunit-dependent GTPase A [Sulfobacillus sp.]
MTRARVTSVLGATFVVATEAGAMEVRPRGALRHAKQDILVGDWVEIEQDHIVAVAARQNRLQRPRVANVDLVILLTTLDRPALSDLDVARRLVAIELTGATPLLVLAKADLASAGERQRFASTYRQAAPVVELSSLNGTGVEQIRSRLQGHVAVLAGASGVGKSTLFTRLTGRPARTGTLSSAGRGRHTTRWAELVALAGGFLVDTPGFEALDLELTDIRQLLACFPEWQHLDPCRFRDCTHRLEPDCMVRQAVDQGRVPRVRYESYLALGEEVGKA